MRQRSRPPGLSRPLRRAAIRKDSSDRGEPVMAAKSVKVTFVGAGGENMAARLDLPQGRPRAYALFAHCFTCSKDICEASSEERRVGKECVSTCRSGGSPSN